MEKRPMAHFSESDNALNSGSNSSDRLVDARVVDAAGNQASIVSIQRTGDDVQAWVKLLDGGTRVLVPVSLLAPDADGVYRLPFTFNIPTESRHPTQMTFPVMEEEVHVSKRIIDTGRGVRIHKTVSEREQVLDQPLLHDQLVVEHVPVGRVIAGSDIPQMRYEGDTLVVPVLEEVLVVQKQLLLKEEVHITRHRNEVRVPETVLLRSEQVTVERFDEGRKQ
jgi:uncharacterized protein (TIGR02271 family)